MLNTRSRSFLDVKFLLVNGFPIFLWHFLRLLKCKRVTKSYVYVCVLEHGDMQKGGFQRIVSQ